MSTEDWEHLYKIILVGDASVGKTHLLSRYIRGTLPKTPSATVGVEFATRIVPLAVGGTVKAQIWDTAGQERYRSITSVHYRRAVGALLIYDITKKATFVNALKWLEDIRQNAEPDIVVMLVGNKVDLVEEQPSRREVPFQQAAKFAEKHQLFFAETSAVSAFNVKNIFESLLQEVWNQKTRSDGGGRQYKDIIAHPSGGVRLAPTSTNWGAQGPLGQGMNGSPSEGPPVAQCCSTQ